MTCDLCHPQCHCGAEEATRLTELERAPAAESLDAALLNYAKRFEVATSILPPQRKLTKVEGDAYGRILDSLCAPAEDK